jgi:hypothetical protein
MGGVTALPRSRPLRRSDLEALPDDGRRHELVDGSLIVTPAPSPRHQSAVLRLALLLEAARPGPQFQVFVAPLDVLLRDDTVLQPDVLVVRAEQVAERAIRGAPLLAVEVLSPSTPIARPRAEAGPVRTRGDAVVLGAGSGLRGCECGRCGVGRTSWSLTSAARRRGERRSRIRSASRPGRWCGLDVLSDTSWCARGELNPHVLPDTRT